MNIRIHIPWNDPRDLSRPQWWVAGVDYSRQQGFQLVARLGWLAIQIVRRCPIINLSPTFTRPTVYAYEFIVHPNGGNATRLICKECGASYTLTPNPRPCAFCAVEKESGIRVYWGRAKGAAIQEGNLMYRNRWERVSRI